MNNNYDSNRIQTIVIGGGQAGLAVGYHLAKKGVPFQILDGSPRIGDAWRNRWDSLRLFNPARFAGLPGLRFPGRGDRFPTKDQVADYLEDYAKRFRLPVRNGVRMNRLWKENDSLPCSSDCALVRELLTVMEIVTILILPLLRISKQKLGALTKVGQSCGRKGCRRFASRSALHKTWDKEI